MLLHKLSLPFPSPMLFQSWLKKGNPNTRFRFKSIVFAKWMSNNTLTSTHYPVMISEVMRILNPQPDQCYCDLFGHGGYTTQLLDKGCKVVALDQDPWAIKQANILAQTHPQGHNIYPRMGKLSQLFSIITNDLNWSVPCLDGVVLDIGVSSYQLDEPRRGFSYRRDGPLDMRMSSLGDPSDVSSNPLLKRTLTAETVINTFPLEKIAFIIKTYGEERYASKIATLIGLERRKNPIRTTGHLSDLISKVIPRPKKQGYKSSVGSMNVAAKTFQALRIYINNELEELEKGLLIAEHLLKPGGKLVVISFHSLEDRIVKNFMYSRSGKRIPKHETFPASFTLLEKLLTPTAAEVNENSRSRSAKLRAAVRTMFPPLEALY